MNRYIEFKGRIKDQKGATIIIVAVSLVVFIGMAAMAIDIGHLYAARNELKNAADAGALAGANVLYNDQGTELNTNANQVASDVALKNRSVKDPVEIKYIQRGHWSFTSRSFTPNDSLTVVDLMNKSFAELDQDPNFINALRVNVMRSATPISLFFARIFGLQNFVMEQESVAYIGFAGQLFPGDVDQPIAICKESILVGGNYSCQMGRMINSSSGRETFNTAAWTNFSQTPCETANQPTVKPLLCANGNITPITMGEGVGTTGGEDNVIFKALEDCWKTAKDKYGNPVDSDGDGIPDKLWRMTLVVIDCPGNNVGPCSKAVGAVTVDFVWINTNLDKDYSNVPRKMEDWTCPSTSTGEQCWNSFVSRFNLKTWDNQPAFYDQKSIYFLPNCQPHEPKGASGGTNFGVLAKIPVLVQ